MEEIEPGDLFVRPARSPEDVSSALSVGDVTQLLEERYRAERADTPFYGQSQERLAAKKEVDGWEDRFLDSLWSIPWRDMYGPLQEEPGLFRTFASIEPSPEGIVAFAGDYGNLTKTCPILVWQEEVLAMRRAICVWELLRNNRFAELRKHFKWRALSEEMWDVLEERGWGLAYKETILVFDSHPDMRAGQRPQYPDRRAMEPVSWYEFPEEEYQKLIDEPDGMTFARGYLRQTIEHYSKEHVHSKLYWSGTKALSRALWPADLLGALWLQFEEAITGRKEYRPCAFAGCGTWLEISAAAGRTTKQYCSDNCRVKAFQARKKAREEEVIRASSGKRKEKRKGKKTKGKG
jgi:hypothetical protein